MSDVKVLFAALEALSGTERRDALQAVTHALGLGAYGESDDERKKITLASLDTSLHMIPSMRCRDVPVRIAIEACIRECAQMGYDCFVGRYNIRNPLPFRYTSFDEENDTGFFKTMDEKIDLIKAIGMAAT